MLGMVFVPLVAVMAMSETGEVLVVLTGVEQAVLVMLIDASFYAVLLLHFKHDYCFLDLEFCITCPSPSGSDTASIITFVMPHGAHEGH